MSQTEIKVPNIGDFKDVEVIEVLVKEGDEVKKNDPLITIESDKSSVEIPSTVDGKIIKLNLKIGDKVSEGDNILQIEINTKSNEKPSKNIEVKKEEKEYYQNWIRAFKACYKREDYERIYKERKKWMPIIGTDAKKFIKALNKHQYKKEWSQEDMAHVTEEFNKLKDRLIENGI